MPRSALALLPVSVLFLFGCQPQTQSTSAHVEEPYTPSSASPYGSDPAYSASASPRYTPSQTGSSYQSLDSMDSAGSAAPAPSGADYAYADASDQPLTPAGQYSGQTYTVAKGDTFYKLARQFYNDQSRWRDIWSANQARVPNPDRLPVGTKLIIP